MQLSECKQGDRVVIHKIDGSGMFKNRLMEMGFTKGTILEIVRYAPLEDPMQIYIKGYHITLRVEEAAQILVETIT